MLITCTVQFVSLLSVIVFAASMNSLHANSAGICLVIFWVSHDISDPRYEVQNKGVITDSDSYCDSNIQQTKH